MFAVWAGKVLAPMHLLLLFQPTCHRLISHLQYRRLFSSSRTREVASKPKIKKRCVVRGSVPAWWAWSCCPQRSSAWSPTCCFFSQMEKNWNIIRFLPRFGSWGGSSEEASLWVKTSFYCLFCWAVLIINSALCKLVKSHCFLLLSTSMTSFC